MKIIYRKQFLKQFNKLERRRQAAVNETVDLFRKNPFDLTLRNHALKGQMSNRRSMSAGFDLRLIFAEHDHYTVVLMLAVGSHGEVY